MASGRFVAPRTTIPPSTPLRSLSTPSISLRSVESSRFPTPPPSAAESSPSRRAAMQSTSSKKRMHGALLRASRNTSLKLRSLSPRNCEKSPAAFTSIKFTAHSAESAVAMSDLPHPDGPCSKMPEVRSMPMRFIAAGCSHCHCTSCVSRAFTSSSPPTLPHPTRLGAPSASSSSSAEAAAARAPPDDGALLAVIDARATHTRPTASRCARCEAAATIPVSPSAQQRRLSPSAASSAAQQSAATPFAERPFVAKRA